MTDLSPAAQAVLYAAENAYGYNYSDFHCCADRVAAGAIRELADQLRLAMPLGDTDADAGVFAAHHAICAQILAIATELEGQ
jgi:hypothetical protein